MNITRYQNNINKPLGGLINDFFNSSLPQLNNSNFVASSPSINIIENKNQFLVEVAAPGLSKEDFNIKVDKDHLIISAQNKSAKENQSDGYTRKGFNYTSFERNFHLPETVDSDQINASYTDGILGITLQKKEEAVDKGPREVSIN